MIACSNWWTSRFSKRGGQRAIVRQHLEATADDVTIGARVVVEQGDAHRLAGHVLYVPGIFLELAFFGTQKVRDWLPTLIGAHLLRDDSFSRSINENIQLFARFTGLGAEGGGQNNGISFTSRVILTAACTRPRPSLLALWLLARVDVELMGLPSSDWTSKPLPSQPTMFCVRKVRSTSMGGSDEPRQTSNKAKPTMNELLHGE